MAKSLFRENQCRGRGSRHLGGQVDRMLAHSSSGHQTVDNPQALSLVRRNAATGQHEVRGWSPTGPPAQKL